MRMSGKFSHKGADDVLRKQGDIYIELQDVIDESSIIFGNTSPTLIKKIISKKFNSLGWGDNIKLGNSRLTISFLKANVGVCFQLGNVARTYADLLKLDYLGRHKIIEIGVIIVPDEYESKLLGMNYAKYNRLIKEIQLFNKNIHTPILVLGISN